MQKSNVQNIRKSLQVANIYAKAGLEFVCIPVVDDAHRDLLFAMSQDIMDQMAKKAEADEK